MIDNPYANCIVCKGKGYVESIEHVTPCMACFIRINSPMPKAGDG